MSAAIRYKVGIGQMAKLAEHHTLYAVLDPCDEPAVLKKIEELPGRAVCLYEGRAREEYREFAPVLATVDGQLLSWIRRELWSRPWGVFVVSAAPIGEIYRHLRKLSMVRSESGEMWYFRYYDPRVLPDFLGVCHAGEMESLYGPVEAYGAGTEDGGVVLYAGMNGEGGHVSD